MNHTTTTLYKTLAILCLLLFLISNILYAHPAKEKLDNNFLFSNNINIEAQPIDTPIFSIISPAEATIGEPFCVDLIVMKHDSIIAGTFFMCVDTAFLDFKNIEYTISNAWLIGEGLTNIGALLFTFLELDISAGASYTDSTVISTICFTPKKEGASNIEFCKEDPRPGSNSPPDIISAKEGGVAIPFLGNDSRAITIKKADNLLLSINTSEIKPTCNEALNGGFSIQVEGGTPPYQTILRNEDNDSIVNDTISSDDGMINVTDLAPGNYSFEVTDSGINQKTSGPQGPILIATTNISIAIIFAEPSCFGANDGLLSAQININGLPQSESANSSIFWLNQNGDTISLNPEISNLGPGEYQIKVADGNGCSVEQFLTLVEPTPIETNNVAIQTPNCPDADGTITINEITGGVAPYTIEWSNGATTAANSGLMDGNFEFTITDSNGCQISEFIDLACAMSTSLEELDEQPQVLIYPNPTVNDLHIQFPEILKTASTIKLLTLTGQLLQTWTIGKGMERTKISLEQLTTGIYLIEIDMDDAVYREKIIKP